jgi:ubiquinol-cytochrome c reductase cytochrome b subunit
MNAVLNWIEERTGIATAVRNWLDRPVAGGPAWRHVGPATLVFALVSQAITGLVLWMYYSPSTHSAWESVYFVQYHVQGGWLLRAMHYYTAQVMLALVLIYFVEMILLGTYRAPREALFWLVVLMGLITLALNLTGDLLAWDQNSYWATHVRTGFLHLLPGIGDDLYKLAVGGSEFGHLTLTRFLALHIGVFTPLLAVLLVLHGYLGRRHGDCPNSRLSENGTVPLPATSYWPRQAARDAIACLLVLTVVLFLSLRHGTLGPQAGIELGAPADPAEDFGAARPEWSFRGLFQFRELFPPSLEILPIFVIPGLLVLVVLAMPWVGKWRRGHWFNLVFVLAILGGLALLSWQSWADDARNDKYQQAAAYGRQQAERARQLAESPQGIPLGGALALLRDDPKTQGPKLFAQYCASCHGYVEHGDTAGEKNKTAPDLYGFATRAWLSGLLDPKQIAGPKYFGGTKFHNEDMVGFVKENFAQLSPADAQNRDRLVIALSAEAELKSQHDEDLRDAGLLKQGRAAFVQIGCTDCHKFRDKGQLGTAPELTGYGSRQWLIGIISDPTAKRFYAKKNDRMPAFAPASNDPTRNMLSSRDLGLLVDWLQWYGECDR